MFMRNSITIFLGKDIGEHPSVLNKILKYAPTLIM